MNHDKFIGEVQHKARLASRGEAEAAVRATLQTLGERLTEGAARNLAAQLPREIGEYLETAEHGERFGVDEFVERVSLREGADPPRAAYHARAVLDVLRGAVSEGQVDKILAQLPDELDRLVMAGPDGDLRL
ncbi:MAG: DUF2267 domain-containing protein [Clostridia bacterium]|nr:DUF2267 domain-containing protein [Clostridia bacterium]